MHNFLAELQIIGINPFVFVPEHILNALCIKNGKAKGPIPIKGTVNLQPYQQTLVKYKGEWRLYINTKMLKNSPKRIGETLEISIAFDPSDRSILPHPKLTEALKHNPRAKETFETLAPSLQKEIVRYIAHLKTDASSDRNVQRAIDFLLGKDGFIGRGPLK
jgi:hypothetical protein